MPPTELLDLPNELNLEILVQLVIDSFDAMMSLTMRK
jgi:hypothetical protein